MITKGYSGVKIYSRREPDEIRTSWRAPFDDEAPSKRFATGVVSFYIIRFGRRQVSSGHDWLRRSMDQWLASGRLRAVW